MIGTRLFLGLNTSTQIHSLSYRNRLAEDRDVKKVFSFLNRELRTRSGFSIAQEYPSVFGEFPGGESLFIEKNEEIVSHVGIVVREYRFEEIRFKVGLIGSVATTFLCRGEGFASILIREAVARLKALGCVLAVLWSDKPDFYAPLGFFRGGQENDYLFSVDSVPLVEEIAREGVSEKEAHKIWRLYQKHQSRLDRSLEEMKALLMIPNVRLFVTHRNEEITSYLAVNKGADFTNYIHEWGGELASVQKNIAFCQREIFKEKKLTLISPSYLEHSVFSPIAEKSWLGSLGLLKIIDRQKLMACYREYLVQNGMSASHQELLTLADAEYLQVMFGKENSRDRSAFPFFLWGFDSI